MAWIRGNCKLGFWKIGGFCALSAMDVLMLNYGHLGWVKCELMLVSGSN